MSASAAQASSGKQRLGLALPAAASFVWLYALIGVLAAMHLSMVFGRSVNWDEFWFYSQVETVARGDAIQPLQTIHTRFFAPWLPGLGGSEVDHILIARFFMLACLAITSLSIFLVAEKLVDRRSALIALAAYLGAGFVLHHGSSFRVDPIVTACLACAFAIGARTKLSIPSILAMGACIGLAAMVTIKMVLWLPTFAGLALYRWEEEGFSKAYPLRWVGAGAVAAIVFAALYFAHSAGMDAGTAKQSAAGTLGRSAEKMFGFLPSAQAHLTAKGVMVSLPLVALAVIALFTALKSEWSGVRKAAVVAIWFPILTPLFYYNSYPYFYAFILPPVAMVSALAVPAALARYGHAIVIGAIAGCATMIWAVDQRGVTERQRELVETVHQIFPEPVKYFDCCGMIGSFEKANIFRTSWGIERYIRADSPLMLRAMREQTVPLFIDNKSEFPDAVAGIGPSTFHPQDLEALEATYVQVWGDIYVAGRNLAPQQTMVWDVLVPGPYTASAPIAVNGRSYRAGEVIDLARGPVRLENPGNSDIRLLWGETHFTPSRPAPDEPYWTGF